MASAAQVVAIRKRLQQADRSTLMTLAKEHGIKANSNSAAIVEGLIEKGYGLDMFREGPHSSASFPAKRKLEPEQQQPTSKRPCVDTPRPGPSSSRAPYPTMAPTYTQIPHEHCSPATYQRIEVWRYSVFQALTTQRLSSLESDPSGFYTSDDDSLDCPDHTKEYQCWKCVSRTPPPRHSNSFRRGQKPSVPPSLAHLLNPESPRPRRQVEKQPSENEAQAVWDELEPSDSSSVRHLRVRPPQQLPQSPHVGSSSHPHHPMLRPTAATFPSSRTISHSHSQSFGRTTDSMDRTTPSHSYPNTPTPVAAPPPIYIPRTGEYSPGYISPCANEDTTSMARIMQEQPYGKIVKPSLEGPRSPPMRTTSQLFEVVTNYLDNEHSYLPLAYSQNISPPFAAPRHGYAYHDYPPRPAPTTDSYTHHSETPPNGAYKPPTFSYNDQRNTPSNYSFNYNVPTNVPLAENGNLGRMSCGPMGANLVMGVGATAVPRRDLVYGIRQENKFFT